MRSVRWPARPAEKAPQQVAQQIQARLALSQTAIDGQSAGVTLEAYAASILDSHWGVKSGIGSETGIRVCTAWVRFE